MDKAPPPGKSDKCRCGTAGRSTYDGQAMRLPSLELRRRTLSARLFSQLATLSVAAMALIMVTGASVRLTGSGLGCADWPTCSEGHVVAPLQFHAWMEFGNRMVTGLVSVAIVVAVLGAFFRSPRRKDLIWLSLGLVAGLIAQIVLGGETVRHHLEPQFVMSHFLLSIVLLANAVLLRHRAGLADEAIPGRPGWATAAGRRQRLVSSEHLIMARLLVLATAVVIVLGTVVTSTGPHSGSANVARFAFSLHDVAQLHGTSVEIYLLLCVVTLWSMQRAGVKREILRRGEWLLVILVAQAGVGYAQYFTGVPALLVGIHVAGAVTLVVAVLWFNLALTTRRVEDPPAARAAVPALATASTGDGG
jgi:cytochrome c oxidase assembly protein subunit 15